jgi:hypothetical protein
MVEKKQPVILKSLKIINFDQVLQVPKNGWHSAGKVVLQPIDKLLRQSVNIRVRSVLINKMNVE